jgi:RNA polymerase sigma factor for flagellar operon FliA
MRDLATAFTKPLMAALSIFTDLKLPNPSEFRNSDTLPKSIQQLSLISKHLTNFGMATQLICLPGETSSVATNGMNPAPPELVVQNYFNLVRTIAKKIKRRLPAFVDVEDLVQIGMVGLFEASQRYDPSRVVDFSTYANPRITGAILDELRRWDTCSRQNRRTARESEQAAHRLRLSMGREPSREEVAAAVGMGLGEYDRVLQQLESSRESATAAADDLNDTDEISRLASGDRNPFEECSLREHRELITRYVDELPSKQREVLMLYYFQDMGLRKIGERLGIGEARVCQIHRQGLRELRKRIEMVANHSGAETPPVH